MLRKRYQTQRRNYRYQNTISFECYKTTTHETYSNNCNTGNYGIYLTFPLMLKYHQKWRCCSYDQKFSFFFTTDTYLVANSEIKRLRY